MRAAVAGLMILLALMIQSTWLQYIEFNGIKPDLVLIIVISVALLRGAREGAATGFFAGILKDLMFGKVFGARALEGLLLGFTVGVLNKRLYKENVVVVVLLTFIFSFCLGVIIGLLNIFMGAQENILTLLKTIIVAEAVYNSVASIFVYYIVYRVNAKITEIQTAARRKY